MLKLADLMADYRLKVHVDREFSLAEAPAAHRFLETAPIGKVVLMN